MRDLGVAIGRKRLQRTDLIRDHVFEIVRTHVDTAATKTPEVIEAWMSADCYSFTLGFLNNSVHRQRIAGMESASDIRGADNLEDAGIVPDFLRSKTLGHVGI
jgi:hypothetical protein